MKRVLTIVASAVLLAGGLTACNMGGSNYSDGYCLQSYSIPMRGGSGSSGYSGGGGRSYGGGYSSRSYGSGSGYSGSRVTYGGRSYVSRYSSSYQRQSRGGVTYVYVNHVWVPDQTC